MDSLKVYFTCSSDESNTENDLKDEHGSDNCDITCYSSDLSLLCDVNTNIEIMDEGQQENEQGTQNLEEKSVNMKEKLIAGARQSPYNTFDPDSSMSDCQTMDYL